MDPIFSRYVTRASVPKFDVTLPRPITSLHQIELTSRCNLRCVYCPSRNIMDGKYPGRPAMDMKWDVYLRALEWVRYYVERGTQHELNLAGTGESTLYPRFVEAVAKAREVVGDSVRLIWATNGLICDEAMVKEIAVYKPVVYVSLHRPEKAGPAIEIYKKYGILEGVSADPSVNANDWAGQVEWHNTESDISPCVWLRHGRAFVMVNGRICTCCLDVTAQGVMGHINNEIGSVKLAPYAVCRKCYQEIAIIGYDQRSE